MKDLSFSDGNMTHLDGFVYSYSAFYNRAFHRQTGLSLAFFLIALVLLPCNFVFAGDTTKLTVLLGSSTQARDLIVLNSNFHIEAGKSLIHGVITESADTGNWVIKTFELDRSLVESGLNLFVSAKRRTSGLCLILPGKEKNIQFLLLKNWGLGSNGTENSVKDYSSPSRLLNGRSSPRFIASGTAKE
jgi:hypothetical protein